MKQVLALLLVITSWPAITFAIVPEKRGSSATFWDRRAVVVGKIVEQIPPDTENPLPRVRLAISAVIATDVTVPTSVTVAHRGAVINNPLPQIDLSDILIACIERDEKRQEWCFPNAIIDFLESGSSVRRITGDTDPAVEQVTARVKRAREESQLERARLALRKK